MDYTQGSRKVLFTVCSDDLVITSVAIGKLGLQRQGVEGAHQLLHGLHHLPPQRQSFLGAQLGLHMCKEVNT